MDRIRQHLRALALLVGLLGFAVPSFAQTADTGAGLRAAAAGLLEKSFSKRLAAVDAIAATGHPRAAGILNAWSKGQLFSRPSASAEDSKIIIAKRAGDGYSLTDAITGIAAGTASAGDIKKVRVNNRIRRAIRQALGSLQLFSPDPAVRLLAAKEAEKIKDAAGRARLEKALAAETDDKVRAALSYAVLNVRVRVGSPAERIAAIKTLGESSDQAVRALMGSVAGDASAPDEVRAAANAAVENIEDRLFYLELGLNLFQGISLGSVLLLAAIGLAITFGVMGVINMAHGEMIMLGAYSAFIVQEVFRATVSPAYQGLYLVAAIPAGFMVAAIIGILLERTVIRHLYGRPLETLLATWGISLVLQQLVRSIFGAPNKEVANPEWMTGGIEVIGGFILTYNRLYIILFCFLVLGVLVLILKRTSFGLHMRAVTQNRSMASSMGIRTARVDAMTFGLGSGIAGMAGVALSQIGNVSPNLGTIYIVDSFMVVVFGGVGNLAGTLVGAMTLGVINKFLEPIAGAVLGKVVVLVIIILFIQRRPQGLFALKGRSVEN